MSERKGRHGAVNGNWKGGRVVASNGYVLVRVGKGHPLADVRGYAYEHRMVAEAKLGRALRDGEQVHHVDGDKTNNDPSNLEVLTHAEHRAEHRADGSNLRAPGEDNPAVACACGCGSTFARYDDVGRPRLYAAGHNPRKSPTTDAIVECLAAGPAERARIAAAAGVGLQAVSVALSKLKKRGVLVRRSRGVWCLAQNNKEEA